MENNIFGKTALLILAVCLCAGLPGCSGDDDPVKSALPPMAGKWILDAETISGSPILTPKDTLYYSSNMTGYYGPEEGEGWYDFVYRIRRDSIFHTRTAGESIGSIDTCGYIIIADTLFLIRQADPLRIQTWLTL